MAGIDFKLKLTPAIINLLNYIKKANEYESINLIKLNN